MAPEQGHEPWTVRATSNEVGCFGGSWCYNEVGCFNEVGYLDEVGCFNEVECFDEIGCYNEVGCYDVSVNTNPHCLQDVTDI